MMNILSRLDKTVVFCDADDFWVRDLEEIRYAGRFLSWFNLVELTFCQISVDEVMGGDPQNSETAIA